MISRYERKMERPGTWRLDLQRQNNMVFQQAGIPGTQEFRETVKKLNNLPCDSPWARKKRMEDSHWRVKTGRTWSAFNSKTCSTFQQAFVRDVSTQVKQQIRSLGVDTLSVKPLRLGSGPQDRFDAAMAEHAYARPVLRWHGTQESNHGSIAKHGLLPAGASCGISKVATAHGQVYGKGIYSAIHPSTARCYASPSQKILLCAVLNNLGAGSVEHIGDFCTLVKDKSCILLVAEVELGKYCTFGQTEIELQPNQNKCPSLGVDLAKERLESLSHASFCDLHRRRRRERDVARSKERSLATAMKMQHAEIIGSGRLSEPHRGGKIQYEKRMKAKSCCGQKQLQHLEGSKFLRCHSDLQRKLTIKAKALGSRATPHAIEKLAKKLKRKQKNRNFR